MRKAETLNLKTLSLEERYCVKPFSLCKKSQAWSEQLLPPAYKVNEWRREGGKMDNSGKAGGTWANDTGSVNNYDIPPPPNQNRASTDPLT
jgi:hypothetical protein